MKLTKTFEVKSLEVEDSGIELVKQYVKDEEQLSNVKVYSAVAYTDKVDRDNEQVDKDGLTVMADKVIGKPICLDHCNYTVDGIIGRVIKAEVETSEDGVNSLVVKFYTPYKEARDKFDTGIYYNVSLGFGAEVDSTDNGVTHLKVNDVYELSVVCVPAVRDAHIKSMNKGGYTMTLKEYKLKQYKADHPELADTIKAFEDIDSDEGVLTDADIEALLNENEELKAHCKELEDTIEQYKNDEFESEVKEAIDEEVEKEVDTFEVEDEEVKEIIVEEVKSFKFNVEVVENGENLVTKSGHKLLVTGITEAVEKAKVKYTKLGLVGKAKQAEVKEVKSKGIDFSINANSENTHKEKAAHVGQTFTFN